MDLYFLRSEDGLYPEKPQATRKIRPDFDRFGKPGPFFPAVLLGDVNGDGKLDVLIHQRSDTEPHRVTMLMAR